MKRWASSGHFEKVWRRPTLEPSSRPRALRLFGDVLSKQTCFDPAESASGIHGVKAIAKPPPARRRVHSTAVLIATGRAAAVSSDVEHKDIIFAKLCSDS